MSLVWKGLIPLTLLNLVCVAVVKQFGLHHAWLLGSSVTLFLGATLVSTAAARQRAAARPRATTGQLGSDNIP
jgi:hypothetical protein